MSRGVKKARCNRASVSFLIEPTTGIRLVVRPYPGTRVLVMDNVVLQPCRGSRGLEAAGGIDDLPGDPAGVVGAEPGDQPSRVIGLAPASLRRGAGNGVVQLRG